MTIFPLTEQCTEF